MRGEKPPGLEDEEFSDSVLLLILPIASKPVTQISFRTNQYMTPHIVTKTILPSYQYTKSNKVTFTFNIIIYDLISKSLYTL